MKHGKITHEYGLSYARGIPYYTLKQMQQSVANVQKLYKKKLDIFDTMYYYIISMVNFISTFNSVMNFMQCQSYKSQHSIGKNAVEGV